MWEASACLTAAEPEAAAAVESAVVAAATVAAAEAAAAGTPHYVMLGVACIESILHHAHR